MNGSYICILLMLLLVIYFNQRRQKSAGCHHAAKLRRKRGEGPVMEAIIMKYLGKGVHVTTINDPLTGKLVGYAEGWLTLTDAKGREKHINADYVIQLKGAEIKY